MDRFLDEVNSPAELKKLGRSDLPVLAGEIRELIVKTVAQNGGHLSSNLGAVELSIALHRVFDSPDDKIIFDVGHQAYTHKILTGRRDVFGTIRTYGGISGFPKPEESEHDAFAVGHSSTSISAALGMAEGMRKNGDEHCVVAVIGDGALTGGLAYEGLDNIGPENSNLVVVLNDNDLSISKNVGAMAGILTNLTSNRSYFSFKDIVKLSYRIPLMGPVIERLAKGLKKLIKYAIVGSNMFESMGLEYFGPIDGHDIGKLEQVLGRAKEISRPSIVHVKTVKGKGYRFSEENPTRFHGIGAFDPLTGQTRDSGGDTFSSVFGSWACDKAEIDGRIAAVTAAMTDGVGLCEFAERHPDRFYDVGIAEGHAATFSAGLASSGMRPVFAVYSTFLQRAVDNVIHDIAMQRLPVVFAVDRAGISGEDGETHQGLFDVPLLMSVPGIDIYAPCTFAGLRHALDSAFESGAPSVVRYPKGSEVAEIPGFDETDGEGVRLIGRPGAGVAIVTYGRTVEAACRAASILERNGISSMVAAVYKLKPLDIDTLARMLSGAGRVYFVEEGSETGGFAEHALSSLALRNMGVRCRIIAVKNGFVPHGKSGVLLELLGFDADGIANAVLEDFSVVQ